MPKILDSRDEDGVFVILGDSITIPTNDHPSEFGKVTAKGSMIFDSPHSVPKIYHYDSDALSYTWEQLCTIESLSANNGISSFNCSGEDFSSDGPIIGTGTLHLSLSPTGISANTYTYPRITVDANGRITHIESMGDTTQHITDIVFDGDYNVSFTNVGSDWSLAISEKTSNGHYTNVNLTVDAYGFVTSADNGIDAEAGITSVTLTSTTMNISNGTITGDGSATINLKPISGVSGVAYKPNLTVDAYGFIHAVVGNTPTDFICPEMFGAVGNGIADDSYAFHNMCEWAAGNYDVVTHPSYPKTNAMRLLPNKTYNVPNGVPFVGGKLYGANNSKIVGAINSSSTFPINNNKYIVMENVEFDGGAFVGNDTVIIEHCIISAQITFDGVSNLVFSNNTHTTHNQALRPITQLKSMIVEDNTFYGTNPLTGLSPLVLASSDSTILRRNSFIALTPYNVAFTNSSTGNIFANNNSFIGMEILFVLNCEASINNNSINITSDTLTGAHHVTPMSYNTSLLHMVGNVFTKSNQSLQIGGLVIGNSPSFLLAWNCVEAYGYSTTTRMTYSVVSAPSVTHYEVF